MTTNSIQDWSSYPHAHFCDSPHVHHSLLWSLVCHHYTTPTSYKCHLMYSQLNMEHHRPCLNEYNHMRATSLSITLTWACAHYAHPPKFLLSLSSIVTILYLVPFLIYTSLFSSQHYHFPAPTLYLRLYLLQLVVWSLDSLFSRPHLHHLLFIYSSLLLCVACPLSQMHRLVSHSLYISLSYLLYILSSNIEYDTSRWTLTLASLASQFYISPTSLCYHSLSNFSVGTQLAWPHP